MKTQNIWPWLIPYLTIVSPLVYTRMELILFVHEFWALSKNILRKLYQGIENRTVDGSKLEGIFINLKCQLDDVIEYILE